MSPIRPTPARVVLACLLASLSACTVETAPGQRPDETSRLGARIIVGQDDRQELYQLTEASTRNTLRSSVGALMFSHRLRFMDDGAVQLNAVSLSEALGLCETEAFGTEPVAAYCSSVLIDDDLMLTAGHCFGTDEELVQARCQHSFAVFGFQMESSDQLAMLSDSDVYACRKVVRYLRMSDNDNFIDFAVIQLDRPVNAAPVRVAAAGPEAGDELLLASYGAGLPLKVETNAAVLSVPEGADYLVAATDSFGGGSGAPLFDANLELVAHQVRGKTDWQISGGCTLANTTNDAQEQHQLISSTLAQLCASALPSERLCGTAPSCGDGLCNGDESAADCAKDCPDASCGDGLCELSEHHLCEADCAAFANVPASWMDDPGDYVEAAPPNAPSGASGKSGGGCAMSRGANSSGWLVLALVGLFGPLRRRAATSRKGRGRHTALRAMFPRRKVPRLANKYSRSLEHHSVSSRS